MRSTKSTSFHTVALPVRAGGVPAVPPHFAAEAASLRPAHGGRPDGSAGVTPRHRRHAEDTSPARPDESLGSPRCERSRGQTLAVRFQLDPSVS